MTSIFSPMYSCWLLQSLYNEKKEIDWITQLDCFTAFMEYALILTITCVQAEKKKRIQYDQHLYHNP